MQLRSWLDEIFKYIHLHRPVWISSLAGAYLWGLWCVTRLAFGAVASIALGSLVISLVKGAVPELAPHILAAMFLFGGLETFSFWLSNTLSKDRDIAVGQFKNSLKAVASSYLIFILIGVYTSFNEVHIAVYAVAFHCAGAMTIFYLFGDYITLRLSGLEFLREKSNGKKSTD